MRGPESETALTRALVRLFEIINESSGLRYLFTGGALFFLDLGIYVFLVRAVGVDIMVSQLISRTMGAGVGFAAHKFISFGTGDGPQASSAASQGVAYTVVMGANILIAPFLVALLSGWVGDEVVGKVLSDAIIIAETYIVLRFIFRPQAT